MQATKEELLDLVENSLRSLPWDMEPVGLYQPIEYVLSLGGKRLRPMLCLLACNLFSDRIEQAQQVAVGLEVFHNFTLLHDDMMDRADTRRGKPTVHKRWNDNTAILSGDAMLIQAYRLIATCPPAVLPKVLDTFSQTALEVCEGQQYDMDFESRLTVNTEEYREMIRLKTAVLLAGSLKIGALIGGASKHDAECLYDFGIHLGIAFQLRDDYLDVFGDEAAFGKKIGGDICCGKKTFLLIRTLEKGTAEQQAELRQWLTVQDPARNSEKIAAITALYRATGVTNCYEEQMQREYKQAVNCLQRVKGNKYDLQPLAEMAEQLTRRNR